MLIFKALPFVGLAVALRYVLTEQFHMSLTMEFADLSPILTGASLILGLMLAGVLADYKEAEKLPATVARSLNDLDGLSRRGLSRIGEDSAWAHKRVLVVAETINDWIYSRVTDDEMWAVQSDMGELILDLDKKGVSEVYLHRLLRINSDGGNALARIEVIRRTNFISAGYALMEILVGGVVVSLAVVHFSTPTIGYWLSAGLSLTYTYLVLLARQIDNPFGHGQRRGTLVDLAPLDRTLMKLRSLSQQ